MREIKFRLWDGTEMFYPKANHDERFVVQLNGIIGKFNGKNYNTVEHDLMQFTGQKDIKGTDIYEGDILETVIEDKVEPKGYCKVYNEVVFKDGAFGILGEITGSFLPFCEHPIGNEVVVGNIYQNKELLKQSGL